MHEPSVNMIIRGKGLKLCVSSFWFNKNSTDDKKKIQYLTFIPITEEYKIDITAINLGQGIQVFGKQDIMLHMKQNRLFFVDYINWSKRVMGKKDINVVGLDEIREAVMKYELEFMGVKN
jgi:hypothetical protein